VFGWCPARLGHRVGFLEWNIEDAHFPRRSDVTGLAALLRRRRLRRHHNRPRIFETQQTPREVQITIAEQVEDERLLYAREPDMPGHPPARAVVDLAAKNVLVKMPGHAC
jgi:hypothetical protein